MQIKKPRILIAVLSYNRSETLAKYTYAWLQHVDNDYKIFIRPDQEDSYRGFNGVQLLDSNIDGLGYALSQIKQYAITNNYDYIFKIDDDLRRFAGFRQKVTDNNAKVATFNSMLLGCIAALASGDYSAIFFKHRNEFFERPNTKFVVNRGRCQTCYIIKTDAWEPESGISTLEDFMVSVKLMLKGFEWLQQLYYGMDLGVPVARGSGGLQSYDRLSINIEEYKRLSKEYPNIVWRYTDKCGYEPNFRATKKIIMGA